MQMMFNNPGIVIHKLRYRKGRRQTIFTWHLTPYYENLQTNSTN